MGRLQLSSSLTPLFDFKMSTFKVGEIVQVGEQGEKGKIIEITKPLGTYNMYKVHMMGSGEIKSAAKHELVKGLADEVFHNLFDCFQPLESTSSTSTMSLTELLNNDQTFNTLNEIDIYENRLNEPVSEPVSAPKSRFVDLPTSPNAFIQTKENKRTKSKISCHINLLKQFFESKLEPRSPEDIPPAELNKYLMEFLLCVRQQNGSEYEPSTLRNMLSSFDR